MTTARMIMVVGVLSMLLLAGCGGSGSSIGKVYEGNWIGTSTNLDNGHVANMRIDMAYEGDDGFGNERISLAWYVETLLIVQGVFYGTEGGLMHIDISEDDVHVELMGNINGDTMTGNFELTVGAETALCSFVLNRE